MVKINKLWFFVICISICITSCNITRNVPDGYFLMNSNKIIVNKKVPFKEDLREVPKTDIGFADRKSVDAAKALISKATLHADNVVDALPTNPFLQHFFGYLESVSLSKPLIKPEDEAKQDVQMMLDNASEEIEISRLVYHLMTYLSKRLV